MAINIMVVEDSGIVALDIKQCLLSLGYQVPAVVSSGEEAVDKAIEFGPDLVLMDIMLKGDMDGIEAAAEIRSRLNIPIIYLTAYSDRETLKKAKITEPFGYIIKPFEERALHTTIEMALYKSDMDKKLRENKKWLRTTLTSIGDAVIATDKEGHVTFMNPVAENLTGWQQEEARGKSLEEIFNIINESTGNRVENPVVKVLRAGTIVGLANHTLLVRRDGKQIPIDDSAAPIKDDQGNINGVVMVFHDITDRRQAEEALRKKEQQLRLVTDNMLDVISQVDLRGNIQYSSPSSKTQLGYGPEEHIGKSIFAPVHPKDRARVIAIFKQNIATASPAKSEYRYKQSDGSYKWLETVGNSVVDKDGKVTSVVLNTRDVTERKQMEEQLQYISLHDSLTGLYNRNYFERELDILEKDYKGPVGMILCDLDGLKLINDTMGHASGDQLLVNAAKVLKETVPDAQVTARVGGDEFALLLLTNEEDKVANAAQRIREAIDTYNEGHTELPLSISIGYALSRHGAGIRHAFTVADDNMYREKLHRGRSTKSAIVQILTSALEARDFITEGHAERLQDLVEGLAASVGLSEQRRVDLRLLAQFHDIGKVGIPDRILFKNGPLTTDEFSEMKRHSEIGYRIAQSAPELAVISDWILKHHEWWNGTGYPLGLKGEEIPVECRILAVADAYDAITNDRPYRKAQSHQHAVSELNRCAGQQFDAQLVAKFLAVLEKKSI